MKNLEIIGVYSRTQIQMQSVRFNHRMRRACMLAAAAVLAAVHAAGQASVLTQHNDIGRTGANTQETVLNISTVNVNKFGKLFSLHVAGQVYAQPLYVPNVTIYGKVHNVLIVATEEDVVFAFDADVEGPALWRANLLDTSYGAGAGETAMPSLTTIDCKDIQPWVGVTSTPVIDSVAGLVYVEATSTNGTDFFHRLHSLRLTTGAERTKPALITATVAATGDGSSSGQLTFDAEYHLNRPGLLLLNGSIYIAYASHCDYSPYHGWLFAYDASTLAQQSHFVTTPNGGAGGIWMVGSGLASDGSYIYSATGNGSFDTVDVPAHELSDSVIKFGTAGGVLSLEDYFTPSDQSCLSEKDFDLGSGGVLVLPDQPGTHPHILAAAGKEGAIYVVNRDQMTANNKHFESSNNCTTHDPQILEESASGAIGMVYSMPAYWNGNLYYWGSGDVLRSIPLVNGLPNFSEWVTNSTTIDYPGATPSISSNGTKAGTAILWAIDSSHSGSRGPGPAVLYAFDAAKITSELWDSTQAPNGRDTADDAVKFTVPTVVNGKVYVGGNSSVTVYGLFPKAATPLLTPPAGTYPAVQKVTIADATPGAKIYYAINGTPTTSSTRYTGPITVSASESLKAIAVAPASLQSAVGGPAYSIVIPVVTPSATTVAFGNENLGATSASKTVTLTNNSTAALQIAISLAGTNASSFIENTTCGASVGVGKTCAAKVWFKPAAAGSLNANLVVTYQGKGSPEKIALTGTGVGPVAGFSGTGLTFPTTLVGTAAAARSFTLTNTGNAALNFVGIGGGKPIVVTGTGASSYSQTNTCGSALNAGAVCRITVTFKPIAKGVQTADVKFMDNATTTPQRIALTGTGN